MMKLSWLTRLSLGLILATVFFSCKKDDVDYNTDRVIAEFTDAASGGVVAFEFTSNSQEVDIAELRLFMRSWAKKDVTVKIKNDPAAIGDFNTANGTTYQALPSSAFVFVNDEYTLTQKERTTPVTIRLDPNNVLNGNYAIGLSITDVDDGDVSGTASTIVVAISVKNKYDGRYNVTGSVVDASGVYTGIHPRANVELRTAGADAVDYLDPQYAAAAPINDNVYVIVNIGTAAPALLFAPRFTFNTTTNKCTRISDNAGTMPDATIGTPNQFTITSPNSKNFQIKYTAYAGRFTVTETYTYVGPRQ
jgi:hypothetical protein